MLVGCTECGQRISDTARTCPICAYEFKWDPSRSEHCLSCSWEHPYSQKRDCNKCSNTRRIRC
ncbi:MAG: zinc-ribbon domain-containing protein [Hyphomonadaceae bacterium]